MKRISVVALAIAALAIAGALYAQMGAEPNATVNVPFSFTVGTKAMPAGEYRVVEQDPGTVLLEGLTPAKTSVIAPIITRLAAQPAAVDPSLVFDKIGGSYTLSEIWFPGFDGYLVGTTTAKHEHAIVKSKKA